MKEVWESVAGYEGLYSVSNLGRVWTHYKNKIMRQVIDRHGYPKLTLNKGGKKKNHNVHRLVAERFVLSKPGENTVNHKDGVKSNNVDTNLEWGTDQHNMIHRSRVLRKTKWDYKIFSPSGEVFETNNLAEFCEEHDLNLSSIGKVAKGIRTQNYGWKATRQKR